MPRSSLVPKRTTSRKRIVESVLTAEVSPPSRSFVRGAILVVSHVGMLFLGALVALLSVGIALGSLYLQTVANTAQIPAQELISTVRAGVDRPVRADNERKNILILGLDALGNRDTDTVLTDTIMVASVHIPTATVTTFSFPRDLYIASQSAKINALYELGKKQDPRDPTARIARTVSEITGLPLHHVVMLDISTLASMIDVIGGLDVEVERSFVDYRFPRTDVDVRTERDPTKLYEVVAFSKGVEHMSGDRALRYIRSRHSLDPLEGSDDARVRRQQRLIAALIAYLKNPSLIRQPETIGSLLAFYRTHFADQIPLEEVVALGYQISKYRREPMLVSYQFPIAPESPEGVFVHPGGRHVSGAWVYVPVDPSWNRTKSLVQSWLTGP